MKNTYILICIIIASLGTSCKKEYNCECKVNGTVTSVRKIEARSEKKAQKECIKNSQFMCIGCQSCQLK